MTHLCLHQEALSGSKLNLVEIITQDVIANFTVHDPLLFSLSGPTSLI